MLIKEMIKTYEFIGTCVNSFDDEGDSNIAAFCDVSDFGVAEEDAIPISKEQFYQKVHVEPKLVPHFAGHDVIYLYSESHDVYMLYDNDEDIHYFFS